MDIQFLAVNQSVADSQIHCFKQWLFRYVFCISLWDVMTILIWLLQVNNNNRFKRMLETLQNRIESQTKDIILSTHRFISAYQFFQIGHRKVYFQS